MNFSNMVEGVKAIAEFVTPLVLVAACILLA